MRYTTSVRKRLFITLGGMLLLGGLAGWWIIMHVHASQPAKTSHTTATTATKTPIATDSFNRQQFSTTDPTSLWVIVNKQHPLSPVTYAPSDLRLPNVALRVSGATEMQLRDPAATALEQLFAGAKTASYSLMVSTAYRGYDYQKGLYDGYVSSQGQSAADQESARPGYSEHQTGLAVDIRAASDQCSLEACFGTMPEGQWLAANAYHYGFILRYPADKTDITGYEYEPWHFRYVGTALAQEMHQQHIETLEEFFHVSGGTTYQ
jgi:D-alanyl-D-alanine carboxypeptidase